MDKRQRQEGEGHAEEIEEEGRGVLQGVFDENKGGSPDGYDRKEEDVGEGGGTEADGQLFVLVVFGVVGFVQGDAGCGNGRGFVD